MRQIRTITQWVILALPFLASANIARAQQTVVDSALLERVAALEQQVADHKPGEDHLLIVGLTTFGFVRTKTTFTPPGGPAQVSKANSFADVANYELSPMFLWRHGTKWLVEFEPSFSGGSLGVNWADVSYFAAPGLIVRAGYLVLPFGIYSKRLAAGWIDKIAGDPMGINPAGTDYGVEVLGGLPLGNMKWSYDVSLSNGLQLQPDGELANIGIVDNNTNKTVTGRLGLLPFSNSSLDIGISGLYGNVADAGSNYVNANATMYAADLNYVKTFSPFLVNVKGQYNWEKVNSQQYSKPTDSTAYNFDNTTHSAFAQISIRPVSVESKLLKDLELAFRYVNYQSPANSLWGQNYHEIDIGLDYWLTWRTVLKFTYSTSHAASTANVSAGGTAGTTDVNSIHLQFSIQL
jgi:hypothetical protein